MKNENIKFDDSVRHICKECSCYCGGVFPKCKKSGQRVGEYESCGKWVKKNGDI